MGPAIVVADDGAWQQRLEAAAFEEDVLDTGIARRRCNVDGALAFERDTIADGHILDIDVLAGVDPGGREAEADGRLVEAAVVELHIADCAGTDTETDTEAAA